MEDNKFSLVPLVNSIKEGNEVFHSQAPIHETTQYAREEVGVADEQIPDSPPDVSLNVDPSKVR